MKAKTKFGHFIPLWVSSSENIHTHIWTQIMTKKIFPYNSTFIDHSDFWLLLQLVLEHFVKRTTLEPYYTIKKIIKTQRLLCFWKYATCRWQHKFFIRNNVLNTVNKGNTINSSGNNNGNLIGYSYICISYITPLYNICPYHGN